MCPYPESDVSALVMLQEIVFIIALQLNQTVKLSLNEAEPSPLTERNNVKLRVGTERKRPLFLLTR